MKTFIRISKKVRLIRGKEVKEETRSAVIDVMWMDAFMRGYLLFQR